MQLKSQFEYEVVTGHIPPGGKLPSVREVARSLKTSPATVVRAYRELELAGLVASQPGSGFYVLSKEEDRSSSHGRVRQMAATFVEDALREGVSLEQALQILLVEIHEAWARATEVRLVVVCKRAGRLDELAMHLRHSLLGCRTEVNGVALEDIAADVEGWLPQLRKVQFVLCLAFDLRQLRELLAPHAIGVVPILGTVREDIQERVVHLPAGTKVGVLASAAEFVDGMISAVLSLNPTVTVVAAASCDDDVDVPAFFSSADVLVHGTLARQRIEEVGPLVAEAIELIYVPEEEWTNRFRRLVKTQFEA